MLLTSYTGQSTKLSGPVSASVIAPDKFLLTFPNAPVFILLGDVHFKFDNMCKDTKPFLYTSSIEFFHSLCLLLKPGEKIDYYYEGDDLRKGAPTSCNMGDNDDPMADVWKLIISMIKYRDQFAKSPAAAELARYAEAVKLADAKLAEADKAVKLAEADNAAKADEFNKLNESARVARLGNLPSAEKELIKSKLDIARDSAMASMVVLQKAKDIYDKLIKKMQAGKELRAQKESIERLQNPQQLVLHTVRWQTGDIRFWDRSIDEKKEPGKKYIRMQQFLYNIYVHSTYKKNKNSKNFILLFKSVVKTANDDGAILDPVIALTTNEIYVKYIENPLSMVYQQLAKIPADYRDYFKEKLKQYISYALDRVLALFGEGLDRPTYISEVRAAYDIIIRASQLDLRTISTTEGELFDLHENRSRFYLFDMYFLYSKK